MELGNISSQTMRWPDGLCVCMWECIYTSRYVVLVIKPVATMYDYKLTDEFNSAASSSQLTSEFCTQMFISHMLQSHKYKS